MEFTHGELKSLIYGGIEQSREKVYTATFSIAFDVPYKRCSKAVRSLINDGLVTYDVKKSARFSLKK